MLHHLGNCQVEPGTRPRCEVGPTFFRAFGIRLRINARVLLYSVVKLVPCGTACFTNLPWLSITILMRIILVDGIVEQWTRASCGLVTDLL